MGIVENPSDSSFKKGEPVFSMMNGMGREFDGSYAEYTLVPSEQVYRLDYDIFKNLDRQYENVSNHADKAQFSGWAKLPPILNFIILPTALYLKALN